MRQDRLLAYMFGWKCGSAGSAFAPEAWASQDFQIGWHDGKKAKEEAYGAACEKYGTTLGVLRVQVPKMV